MEYIDGDQNRVADALSRLGFTGKEQSAQEERELLSPMSIFAPRISTPKVLGEYAGQQPLSKTHNRGEIWCSQLHAPLSVGRCQYS